MLVPGQIVDRYTVEAHLGTGGMAVVYRVRHNQLDSLHALKVLSVTSPQITGRLLQEGKVQAALQHPNIVAVTDVIEVDGAPGLVMEYVDGPPLDAWLQTNEPELEEAERLFRGIVAGVAAAHERGVVHRDLKPANVMLSGRERTPKVTDFGLAKALVDSRGAGLHETRSGMTMGTPAYMAPEQIRDAKTVDARADIFSLGCILYELVTNEPAFTGPDILSIFNAVAQGRFVEPVSLVPDLPSHLRDAILGCLVVDRDKRIPDCATLQRVLDGGRWGRTPPRRTDSLPTWDNVPAPNRGADGAMETVAPATFPAPEESGEGGSLVPRPRTPSMGSLAPRKRLVVAGGVLGTGAVILGILIVAAAIGLFAMQRSWVARARSTLEAAVGAPIAFGGVALRPGYVRLSDARITDPSGARLAVGEIRVDGTWGLDGLALRFDPTTAAANDVSVTVARTAEGWTAPAGLERISALGALEEVTASPVAIVWQDGDDHLQLRAAEARVAPTDGSWSLATTDWAVGGVASGASLVALPDGRVEIEDLELTVEVGRDGRAVVPAGLRDVVPVYLGGASPRSDLASLVDGLGAFLPARPTALSARGGQIVLLDRAHGVKAVRWEADLSQLSVGPWSSGFLPFDAVAGLGGARVTLEGDVDAEGLIRGRVSSRRLPLDPMIPYLHEALSERRVELVGGVVDGDVRFSMKADSFAGRLTATVSGVRLSGPGAATVPDDPAPIDAAVVGSLADPRFSPVADWLDALEEAILGEPPRPVAHASAPSRRSPAPRASRRPELASEPPTARKTTPEPADPPEPEPEPERAGFEDAVRRALEALESRPLRRR